MEQPARLEEGDPSGAAGDADGDGDGGSGSFEKFSAFILPSLALFLGRSFAGSPDFITTALKLSFSIAALHAVKMYCVGTLRTGPKFSRHLWLNILLILKLGRGYLVTVVVIVLGTNLLDGIFGRVSGITEILRLFLLLAVALFVFRIVPRSTTGALAALMAVRSVEEGT